MVISSTLLLSGISGSHSANTATIGSVAIPAMMRMKYPRAFATALLATAGGGSTLIPPSIDLIIVGVIANISIGGLFATGVFTAIVNGLGMMGLTYYFARKMRLPLAERIPWRQKLKTMKNGSLAILTMAVIIGGIYAGIFTTMEAASVAVVYGLITSYFII